MNKFLNKVAELKEPAHPEALGFDLSTGDEKELYKWLTAVTLFSKPIQRPVAAMAAKHMADKGFHSPEAVESAGWEALRDALIEGHYGRFDESTATTMLAQAKHLREQYGTLGNLIDQRTPEEIRTELQSFRGIGPLASQLYVEGVNPYLGHIQKQAEQRKAVIVKGNPKYLMSASIEGKASDFYNDIKRRLEAKNFTVSFDEGKPYTIPDETAHLWVGHSRGVDRLQYAPENVATLAIETRDKGKSYKTLDEQGLDSDHYRLSEADIEALNKQASLGIIQTEHGEKIPFERHKYVEKDWSQLENPIASNKFDGAHFFLVVQPDGTFKYYSRRQSVKGHNPERSAQIPQLNANPLPQYAGDVFSTELIHTGFNKERKESHPKVSGILNSLKDRAIATQKEIGPVRAVLLDVKDHNLPTFGEKVEYLKQFEKAYGQSDLLFTPEFAEGHENINKYLQNVTAKGSEGIIVTDKNLPESENPRYKVKNFNTYNLRVIGFQREIDIHGNPKNSMGALLVADATGRFVGKVGTGFDRATRIESWKNQPGWIGRMIQVKAYPPSKPGGHIRFPIYNGEPDGELDTIF